jgi:hypothetical protein
MSSRKNIVDGRVVSSDVVRVVHLLIFHAYINEMHGSRSKIRSKKSRPYIHDVKFLALLGAPYIYTTLVG